MDNLRGLLGISRMDKVPNAWIKELCGVTIVVGGTKGLMNEFSGVSAMWSELRIIRLLRGSM